MGPAKTVFATNTQGATNWNPRSKFILRNTGKSFEIRAGRQIVWSSGRFECADRLVMGNDGNLQSFCGKTNKPMWSMGLGAKGPERLGK